MTFLRKGIWLSLWQTQNISLLRSSLTTLKCYNIGCHVKFIVSVKYYQQPLSKLARSTNKIEKEKLRPCLLITLPFKIVIMNICFFLKWLKKKKNLFLITYHQVRDVFSKHQKNEAFFYQITASTLEIFSENRCPWPFIRYWRATCFKIFVKLKTLQN